MRTDSFIQDFEKFKRIKNSNYKKPIWIAVANVGFFLFYSYLMLKFVEFFNIPILFVGAIITIAIMAACSISNYFDTEPSFLEKKFSLYFKAKRKVKKGQYIGSLSDIFALDCPITKEVISEYSGVLEEELMDNKYIHGETILSMYKCIEYRIEEKRKEDEAQEEYDAYEEEKEALMAAETKVGQSLKEIARIKAEQEKINEEEQDEQ